MADSDDDRPNQELKRRTAAIARCLRSFIKPKPQLDTGATFIETLVATILSQNTSDANSARAYRQLQATYSTWEELAAADRAELARVIRSGGLADQKSRTILDVLAAVRQRYGSFDPAHLDSTSDDDLLAEFTSLKGVGLKTAACVLMFSLGRDVCAVDTHVHRVVNRLGIVKTSTPEKTFHALRPLIPKGRAREFHVDLILFGRRICKAQRPHCFECPAYDLCAWDERAAYAEAAVPGPEPVSGDLLLLDMFPERSAHARKPNNPPTQTSQDPSTTNQPARQKRRGGASSRSAPATGRTRTR